jgi:hypothetical protein
MKCPGNLFLRLSSGRKNVTNSILVVVKRPSIVPPIGFAAFTIYDMIFGEKYQQDNTNAGTIIWKRSE